MPNHEKSQQKLDLRDVHWPIAQQALFPELRLRSSLYLPECLNRSDPSAGPPPGIIRLTDLAIEIAHFRSSGQKICGCEGEQFRRLPPGSFFRFRLKDIICLKGCQVFLYYSLKYLINGRLNSKYIRTVVSSFDMPSIRIYNPLCETRREIAAAGMHSIHNRLVGPHLPRGDDRGRAAEGAVDEVECFGPCARHRVVAERVGEAGGDF